MPITSSAVTAPAITADDLALVTDRLDVLIFMLSLLFFVVFGYFVISLFVRRR